MMVDTQDEKEEMCLETVTGLELLIYELSLFANNFYCHINNGHMTLFKYKVTVTAKMIFLSCILF